MNGFALELPKDNKPSYPIYLLDNKCIHCGSENTLSFIDKFGNWAKEEVFDIVNISCTKCKTVFDVLWIQQDDGKYKPFCTEKNIHHLYDGYLRQSLIK